MGELLLYGLDEADKPTFTEVLHAPDRGSLRSLAQDRLRDCHAVEIWEGPLCVVRLRRRPAVAD